MNIRDATPADFEQILALNAESVHFLSPLSAERLQMLHGQAVYHRVVQFQGRVVGFLIALREGAAYDSVNYQWFVSRFPKFLYIDRVVVSTAMHGLGVGKLLYADLFAFGRAGGAPVITCEFDVDPPNVVSQRFHEGYGFKEIGSHRVGASQKRVSLQAMPLGE